MNRSGRARGRGVQTRGGRGRGAIANLVLDEEGVVVVRGGRGGGGRGVTRGGSGRGVRTRGSSGRGVRTRGGSGRGVRMQGGQQRPHANDTLDIDDIGNLPRGVPLEVPLHPRRKRIWDPSCANVEVSQDNENAPPAEEDRTTPQMEPQEEDNVGNIPQVEHLSMSPAFPPSPAMFVECGETTPERKSLSVSRRTPQSFVGRKRPLQDDDIWEALNYGSESSDSGTDEDEDLVPMIVPRVFRAALETPLDDEETEHLQPAAPSPAAEFNVESMDVVNPNLDTMLPRDMFHFEWAKFPNTPLPPHTRRETFSPVGVAGPTTPTQDIYEVFTSIWDLNIMEHIARETNRYAQEVVAQKMANDSLGPLSRICFWQDTTPNELYTYFAIILAMGIVIKSKVEEYWAVNSDIFVTPGFRANMPLKRYQLLNCCLHFNNNAEMRAQELSPSEAKLFKIEPILAHLNTKFQILYNLHQNIALDESLLQWKGWLDINQFISNKAATVGIKTYEICESQTGYLWRFEVQTYKKASTIPETEQTPTDAPTPALVLRLIHGLENKGHTLWMDNYYNSPALARRLKSLGFDVVGTLRTNRQFVPHELKDLTKLNMKQGQITGYTAGDVDIMVWRDQNRVATISTYHGNATCVSDKGTVRPILINDYNIMMGGVDKKDQMLAMYPIERKRNRVWYKKLFRRLLNVSVLNSYIICKKSSSSANHRSSRMSLINSLLSRHNNGRSIECVAPLQKFDTRIHHLAEYPIGKNKSRLRRKCCVCKHLTHHYCVGCEKSVCLTTCFLSFHS